MGGRKRGLSYFFRRKNEAYNETYLRSIMLFRKKEPIPVKFLRENPNEIIIEPTYMAAWSKKAKTMVMKFGDFRELSKEEAFLILKKENKSYL
jgi:hypothetical protein